jgi:hypothetical protein
MVHCCLEWRLIMPWMRGASPVGWAIIERLLSSCSCRR